MRRIIRISVFTGCLGIVLVFCLLSASVYTFTALTDETLIAEVRFEPVGEQHYIAHLVTGGFCEPLALPIYGDQWRIDAEFLKWRYWASLVGLDSQYRLDRFEGRYADVSEQNVELRLAHELGRDHAIDVVSLAESLGRFNVLLDATYGSSTYQDIDPARVYYVYKSPTGIFTRSAPEREAQLASEGLHVEITRGCATAPSYWQRFVEWADAAVVAALSSSAG